MDPLHMIAVNETDPSGGGIEPPLLPEPLAAEPAAPAADAGEAGWQGFQDEGSFLSAVDQRAAEMFEARLNALVAQQQPQQGGGNVDLNQLLDPMGDGFGTNLVTLLHGRDEQILQQLQPVLDFVSSQQQATRDEAIAAPILQADQARHGDMTEPQRQATAALANSFLAEQERIYGQGNDRAAAAALQRAVETVRAIAGSAAQQGAQANIDQLHAVTGGLRVPATGGAGTPTSVQPPARSPQELLERTFGPNGMSPLRAA